MTFARLGAAGAGVRGRAGACPVRAGGDAVCLEGVDYLMLMTAGAAATENPSATISGDTPIGSATGMLLERALEAGLVDLGRLAGAGSDGAPGS